MPLKRQGMFCYVGLLLVVVLFQVCVARAVEVETKTVEVMGTGVTLKDAIADGLVEAIGQVAGRFVEAETAIAIVEVSESDGRNEKYFSGQAYQAKISSATKGAIKGYTILEHRKNDEDRYEVQLSVICLKVIPSLSNRKRLVCATFAFSCEPNPDIMEIKPSRKGGGGDKPTWAVASAFTDHLEAYLVQSRRFVVQDRRQTEAVANEKKIILEGNTPIEDVLKVTFDNPADLVVVGGVETVDYGVTKRTMRSGKEVQIGEGFVEIRFRVVDVPSKQVKYADRVRYVYTDRDLQQLSGSFSLSQAGNVMMADAANRVGKQILEAIYPLVVVNVTGNRVTLNEGGRGIRIGQIYDVYGLGAEQFDPYTKERLGRLEIPVGKIRITSSSAKMSAGEVIEKTGAIAEGSICRLSPKQGALVQADPASKPGKKLSTDDFF